MSEAKLPRRGIIGDSIHPVDEFTGVDEYYRPVSVKPNGILRASLHRGVDVNANRITGR
ncbi:MAG: hypothetical protein V6Z81_03660 [Parvularculales bacterium]